MAKAFDLWGDVVRAGRLNRLTATCRCSAISRALSTLICKAPPRHELNKSEAKHNVSNDELLDQAEASDDSRDLNSSTGDSLTGSNEHLIMCKVENLSKVALRN